MDSQGEQIEYLEGEIEAEMGVEMDEIDRDREIER